MKLADEIAKLNAGGPGSGRHKESDKLRDMDNPSVLGYDLVRHTLLPRIHPVINTPGKDHGADPIWENGKFSGKYRMVPSGDIVDQAEHDRRLKK